MGLEHRRLSRNRSTRVSNFVRVKTLYLLVCYRDGEEYVDPYLEDKVDPVDTPLPTRATFLVALPSTAAPLSEHDFPTSLPSQHEQQHRRSTSWSPQRRHPYSAPLKDNSTCQWELASASSREESGIDDDWHQFRVEWIDFGVDGSR